MAGFQGEKNTRPGKSPKTRAGGSTGSRGQGGTSGTNSASRRRQLQQRRRIGAGSVRRTSSSSRGRTAQRLRRSQALAAVARAVAGITGLSEWGAQAVEVVEAATGWHRVFLFRLVPESLQLVAALGITPEQEAASSQLALDGDSLSALAVRRRQPVVYGRDEIPEMNMRSMRALGMRSCAVFPLVARERVYGTLTLLASTEWKVDDEEFDFLRAVADALAIGFAGEELYASAEAARVRLSTTFDQMVDGVIVFGPKGEFVEANPAARRMLPDVAESWSAAHDATVQIRHADGQPMEEDERPNVIALSKREAVSNLDLVVNHRDGTRLELSASAAPLVDDAGRLLGAVTTLRDVTALRRLERAKDDFLSVASHELRTPLTPLKGLSQSLLRQLDRAEAAGSYVDLTRVRRYLRTMDGQVDRLAGLVNDLLDVSRIRTGRLELNIGRVNLTLLVEAVLDRFEAIAAVQVVDPNRPARHASETDHSNEGPNQDRISDQDADSDAVQSGHILVFRPEAEEIIGHWDGARLEQVVTNLIANSLKYTPSGGEIQVTVLQEQQDGVMAAHLEVKDPGIGIPPEQIAELFQPFHRLQNAPAEHFSGLGLGLFISRDIVARHGGQIWAESPGPGKGATFHVSLPLNGPANEV